MWNFLNHPVGKQVCAICQHSSSAGWTSLHIFSTSLTHDVTHWTRGDGKISGDEEAHRTLQLVKETIKSCGRHHLIGSYSYYLCVNFFLL